MKTVSLKMPEDLEVQLSEAARRTGRSKSLLVRMALSEFLPRRSSSSGRSFLARATDLAGCVAAAPDLSTNKRRLRGYGR
jgi:predicted transcriptional regulator